MRRLADILEFRANRSTEVFSLENKIVFPDEIPYKMVEKDEYQLAIDNIVSTGAHEYRNAVSDKLFSANIEKLFGSMVAWKERYYRNRNDMVFLTGTYGSRPAIVVMSKHKKGSRYGAPDLRRYGAVLVYDKKSVGFDGRFVPSRTIDMVMLYMDDGTGWRQVLFDGTDPRSESAKVNDSILGD